MPAATLDQRLAAFPGADLALRHPVQLRWNAHAVPYIDARTDEDAAYALGLVHVHLRCAQMHLLKRLAQGRVSEMFGPFGVGLDHALRLLDLPGAAARCEAALSAESRNWLEPFVRGLNAGQAQLRQLPPEFRWLGLRAEPWTLTDVLTLGRLAGADVNWTHQLALLAARHRHDFRTLWQRLRVAGGTAGSGAFGQLLAQVSRAGSNSVAIAASRSASGAPLMANDPHLGQHLPNFWMLVGLRCPSYHMVGLMPPGLPFVGVGAGPRFAWGGTNMRAASSDLVDVSTLAPTEIQAQETVIRVRGLGTRRRTIRRTRFGPILNDARLLKIKGDPVALRWMGAEPSDEIGAFLAAARATTPDEFRAAFKNFGVCAQNILFASRDGAIGHVYAAHLPQRRELPDASPILTPGDADAAWRTRWDATTLPMTLNPECGFRVSANDRPQFTEAPLGFFFSEGDRAARLAQLAERNDLGLLQLGALQNDTVVPGASRLAAALAARLVESGVQGRLIDALRNWDGDYAAGATTPVLFEALLHAIACRLEPQREAQAGLGLDDEWGRHTRLLLPDLDALGVAKRQRLLRDAARAAEHAQARHPTWGDMHRLRIGHVLSLVPWLGRRLLVAEWGAGGTRESPMKNSHGLVRGRHPVQYGAQARHLSDLSDPDANHFVLLGGNDGWIGSAQYADQIPLWREQRYLRLPLTAAAVERDFPIAMDLLPHQPSIHEVPARSRSGASAGTSSATSPSPAG